MFSEIDSEDEIYGNKRDIAAKTVPVEIPKEVAVLPKPSQAICEVPNRVPMVRQKERKRKLMNFLFILRFRAFLRGFYAFQR